MNTAGYPLAGQPYLLHLRHAALASDQRADAWAAALLGNLGALLSSQGDYAGARPYYERALAINEQVLGPQHPDTATGLDNLGGLLKSLGDLAGARPHYERALSICAQRLGSQHPTTLTIRRNLTLLVLPVPQRQSATEQISTITQQAEAVVAVARATGSRETCAALAAALEALIQWAEDGEDEDSPYLALAAKLRAWARQLGE